MTSRLRRQVTVFAPATVANVGPGFDVLGLALEQPGDRVQARPSERPGVRLTRVTGDEVGRLPPPADDNTAAVAARQVLELLGHPFGVELSLHKGLAVGSGLGSSGASAAAAATAVNLLAGAPLPPEQLVGPCAAAEAAASGAAHADNVAPALLGGITLVRAVEEVVRIRTPLELYVALAAPPGELPTRLARTVIPQEVPIAEAVHNAAHLAALVYALAVGDAALLARSLRDRIAEPRRAPLIPGCTAALEAAREAGALGGSISGAGPTLFALCPHRPAGKAARDAMARALGPGARTWLSRVAERGARELDPEEIP